MANGVELATAYVSLTVDGSQVDSGVHRSLAGVDAQADAVGRSSGKKMGGGISSGVLGAVGRIAGPLAAIFAGIQVGKILGSSIDEALEAQKVGAATDAIIKSTGGVAKVSAKQVADLSGALSEKIGVDDELIQTGANLLLTFKNVRNEAGKNNQVFDEAVGLANDLSAAGFGSVESASKTLGKALNDPIKGMTALGRAGVTFSDEQRKQIKNMVESGDLLGAQKVILGEVKSQVGGVAEATATTADKVKVSWDNVKERIGTALLPVLERLGTWFLDKGLPALEKFGGYVANELWPALKDGWETVRPGLEDAKRILDDAFGGESGSSIETFAAFITDTLIPAFAEFTRVWLPAMAAGWAGAAEIVRGVGSVFEFQVSVVRRFADTVIGIFVTVAEKGADMLDALSRVPGFGWAKDAADKLRGVADKANEARDAILGIPTQRRIEIIAQVTMPGRITLPNGERVNIGLREHGGPVRKGQPYIVGEKRPELFVPDRDGKILPSVPEPAMAGAGGGGGIDYWRLAEAMGDTMRQATFAVDTRDNARAVARHHNRRQGQ